MKYYLTSESVNCGHPDKTCDIIADAILDEALKVDPSSQMAVECAIKDNNLFIYGEATTKANINYDDIAKQILSEIGYDANIFKITKVISEQSPDISQAVIKERFTANDQGMMFGYATNETKELMPMPILLAHKIMYTYEQARKNNIHFFSDAKTQVTIEYNNKKLPERIDTILISASHTENVSHNEIEKFCMDVINNALTDYLQYIDNDTKYIINPSGKFTIWGSFSDSGCVGRKIIVDTYGGIGRHGGGCFSSKNATKVDRSGAYYARYVAKNIVAHNFADKCEIEVAYAIGLEEPLSIYIDCFDTNKESIEKIYDYVKSNFSFNVNNIINELDLNRPIYKDTACYGHFGRDIFSWEKIKE